MANNANYQLTAMLALNKLHLRLNLHSNKNASAVQTILLTVSTTSDETKIISKYPQSQRKKMKCSRKSSHIEFMTTVE